MKKVQLVLSLLLVVSLLSGCTPAQEKAPELVEPVGVRVATAQVKRDTVFRMKTYGADVVPRLEQVCFEMDGYFGEYFVAVGDWVEQGQLLATLDIKTDSQLIESQQRLIDNTRSNGEIADRKATAEIKIAKAQLLSLQEQGGSLYDCTVKELEIKTLETNLRQTQELRNIQLDAMYSALEKLQESVENSKLIAPISGRVVYLRPASQRDSLKTIQTVVCIADETQLTLQTDYIAQKDLDKADRLYAKVADQEVDVTALPYDLTEYIKLTLAGKKMKIHFSVDTPMETLESGQYAQIIALYDYKEDVLTVPINTLYRDRMGRHVYKLVDGNWERCAVTVGVITDTKVEILEGLSEGDVVRGSE